MNGDKGFTLIELLVVIAVVGVLSTIAIYQFAGYKIQTQCATLQSDVKNTVIAQEAVFAETQAYDATVVKTGTNFIIPGMTPAGDGTVAASNATNCPGKTYTFTQATGIYSW